MPYLYYLITELVDKFWNFLIQNINVYNYKYETMSMTLSMRLNTVDHLLVSCPTELIVISYKHVLFVLV